MFLVVILREARLARADRRTSLEKLLRKILRFAQDDKRFPATPPREFFDKLSDCDWIRSALGFL